MSLKRRFRVHEKRVIDIKKNIDTDIDYEKRSEFLCKELADTMKFFRYKSKNCNDCKFQEELDGLKKILK